MLTDNGCKNHGAFAELLASQPLEHHWARPHTPKDKPHVERFIGTLEKECFRRGALDSSKQEQQILINEWLVKYHKYRPRRSLNYLTPNDYKAKLEAEVSSMNHCIHLRFSNFCRKIHHSRKTSIGNLLEPNDLFEEQRIRFTNLGKNYAHLERFFISK